MRVTLAFALFFLASGCMGLKCKVGVSILTKEVECSGSWDSMKTTLAKYGGNMTDWSSIFSSVTGRKKRQAAGETTVATTTAAAATTTENPNAYYCIKHTVLGSSIKACAPKSVLGITKTLCKEEDPDTCACNTELCNSGVRGAAGLMMVVSLALFSFI